MLLRWALATALRPHEALLVTQSSLSTSLPCASSSLLRRTSDHLHILRIVVTVAASPGTKETHFAKTIDIYESITDLDSLGA